MLSNTILQIISRNKILNNFCFYHGRRQIFLINFWPYPNCRHFKAIQNVIAFNSFTIYQHDVNKISTQKKKIHSYRKVLSNIKNNSKTEGTGSLVKTVTGSRIIQNVLEQKRDSLIEKKNVLVKKKNVLVSGIRDKKTKVKAKVRKKMEEVIEKENIFTIPNGLTISRMIISPYLGYVITQGDFKLAVGLLVVAGITDLLDGQIARYWPEQSSKFGSFMDPLADKLLIGSLAISMGYCELLPIWLAGMVLFRDIFLISAGFVIRYISLPPPRTFARYFDATNVTAQLEPTFISKVNTAVQLTTIGLSLGAPIWNYIDHPALHVLWYLTGATTIAAAISYIKNKNTYKILKK